MSFWNPQGSAYRFQNQPAAWNGNSYTGPIDQSYQNIARGDQFTGTRDGFLWVAGNRIMPSYGDQARDRLELQTNFGVGGLSPNTNPFYQGSSGAAPPAASGSQPIPPPPSAPQSPPIAPPVYTAPSVLPPDYKPPAGVVDGGWHGDPSPDYQPIAPPVYTAPSVLPGSKPTWELFSKQPDPPRSGWHGDPTVSEPSPWPWVNNQEQPELAWKPGSGKPDFYGPANNNPYPVFKNPAQGGNDHRSGVVGAMMRQYKRGQW